MPSFTEDASSLLQILEDAGLAEEAHGRWLEPVPSGATLAALLEVAFLASLEPEEGAYPTFALLCTNRPAGTGHIPVATFAAPFPLQPGTIPKIAAGIDSRSSAMVVDVTSPTLDVWGLARLTRPAPRHTALFPGLLVRVTGPAEVRAELSGEIIWQLRRSVVRRPTSYRGTLKLIGRALGHPAFGDWRDGVLVGIAAAVVRQNHGGTVVVDRGLRPDVELQPYGQLSPPSLILETASEQWAIAYEAWEKGLEGAQNSRVGAELADARWTAWNEYADAIEWVATLAGVDGAVLLSRDDFAVLAFGVHLKEVTPLAVVQLLDPNPAGGVPTLTAVPVPELGGTRHRSAVHWVNAAPSDRLAVVASHDGLVSLVVPIADGVGVVRPMPLLER